MAAPEPAGRATPIDRATEAFARWLVQPHVSVAVVVGTILLGALATVFALDVEQDDDVLAFLPDSNPEIRAFREINAAFGSTDVALIGLPVEDPFDPAFLRRLQELTRVLRDTDGLDGVLSLTNLTDFRADPEGGVIIEDLVAEIPRGPAEREALRARVMSRDHVVGTLISEDEDAVLLYAFATPGAQPRQVAGALRAAVSDAFPHTDVAWGGGPFLSSWIYETTQEDMARLTPWAVLAIVVVLLLSFRDLPGTLLGLLATTIGLAVSRAAMALLGVSFNIVLSAMPVILFATGSAYAIHMLSDHHRQARAVGPGSEAVVRTLVETAPANGIAALTTMAGLGSLLWMDIAPLRVFGVFTALGVIVAMLVSLTFVPAVIALWPRPYRPGVGSWTVPASAWLARSVRASRPAVGAASVVLGLVAVAAAVRVETRMDLASFFDEDSEPAAAMSFLDRAFGGSQFLQILVEGDLEDPALLREIGHLSDELAVLPGVADVRGLDDALGLVGASMVGVERVPDTRGQVATLFRFLENDRGTPRLVTPDRQRTLVQVKLAASDAASLDALLVHVEALVEAHGTREVRVIERSEASDLASATDAERLVAHVRALARRHEVHAPNDLRARVLTWFGGPRPPADPAMVREGLHALLRSEAALVALPEPEASTLATSLAGPPALTDEDALRARVLQALPDLPPDDADGLVATVATPLRDLRRESAATAGAHDLVRAAGLTPPLGSRGERFLGALAAALHDLDAPSVLVPTPHADPPLRFTVSGMPVLYRGLSESVAKNQISSFTSALLTVVVLMSLVYRSLGTGLLVAVPTGATLVFVYAVMGLRGVHLDIGTSLIASLVLGDSVDYAVHTLHAWRAAPRESVAEAAERGVRHAAHGVWTNALMVASGFFVLTLGRSRPLQNVGALVAAAMLLAALTTFVFLPLLARQRAYRRATPYET